MGIRSMWRRAQEVRARKKAEMRKLDEAHELYCARAEAIVETLDRCTEAIKAGNLALAKEIQIEYENLPCPWCGRTGPK